MVNTCSVTARADATARKAIRRINADHPEAKIVVAGCYAQRAPEELAALPGVALVVGAADRARVAELIDRIGDGPPVVAVSPISTAKSFLDVPITEMTEHSRAFVKVQEGCNESCTFCIVPRDTRRLAQPDSGERARPGAPARRCRVRRGGPPPGCTSATTGSISPSGGACCPI